jgi:RES domain-containing protein
MFQLIAAGTRLYRVTDIGRTWQDVVSGVGSYFTAGGRYNRVQQRTVYAATDPLVAIAESAFHVAIDRWQPRIGRGPLSVQPALAAPVPPLVSEHWLWCFTVDADLQLIDAEDPAALATFHHRLYELLNPSEAYRATATLADAIRLHLHPHLPKALVDGILVPSVRTPSLRGYIPRQQVFFVPPNQLILPATLVRRWRMDLEFADHAGQSIKANTRVIDWANPWFRLSNSRAPVPAFSQRPNAQPFAPGTWYPFRVKYA